MEYIYAFGAGALFMYILFLIDPGNIFRRRFHKRMNMKVAVDGSYPIHMMVKGYSNYGMNKQRYEFSFRFMNTSRKSKRFRFAVVGYCGTIAADTKEFEIEIGDRPSITRTFEFQTHHRFDYFTVRKISCETIEPSAGKE
jgi:hypothetical protein